MKFRKSKTVYLAALLMLSLASFFDKISPDDDRIEVSISANEPSSSLREFASMERNNQNIKENEKASNTDIIVND